VRESDCTDGVGVLATLMGPKTAGEMMTPTLFAVAKTTPAAAVVRDMLQTNVHHLFVTDDDDTVIGVISTKDILRHLN
jgi:CBS domain-containing protein